MPTLLLLAAATYAASTLAAVYLTRSRRPGYGPGLVLFHAGMAALLVTAAEGGGPGPDRATAPAHPGPAAG
jgi:hypothetical protein